MKSCIPCCAPAMAVIALLAGCETSSKPANQEAMMAKMMEVGTPTAKHDVLKGMVGTWKARNTHWMDENSPPQVSDGTLVVKAINDGRYFSGEYVSKFDMPGPDGKMVSMPFTGQATWAYSVADQEYQSTWTDSWSTGIMYSTGSSTPDGKSIEMVGYVVMPDQTGELRKHAFYDKTTLHSASHMVSEMWIQPAGQAKRKCMEIVYSR